MARSVILCVDDEKVILDTLERQIRKSNIGKTFDVELAESGEEALEIIEELDDEGAELAVVISDQIMPGMKGDELLIAINQSHPQTLKILLTGQASLEAVTNAINYAKLYRYVSKPWDDTDLMLTVEEAARSFQQYVQIVEFDQHNRLLKALNHATQEISGATNHKDIAEKLIKCVQSNTQGERIFLVLKNDDDWKTEALFCLKDEEHNELNNRMIRDNQSISKEILGRINPLLSVDQPSKNNMVIPISRGEDLQGYLLIENPFSKQIFNSNQYEIMKMMAAQASISFEKAELYASMEEQNRDILDSIQYARRIQYSLLPNKDVLYQFFPDSFVYYQPRDIVSGDFYWFVSEEGRFFIAAVDCTGHGVPGAFMSVLGSTQLNEIVKQLLVTECDQILSEQHYRIAYNLGKNEPNANIYDGMDMALSRFDPQTKQIQYAGANRPLLVLRGDEIIEIGGDKKPIGHAGAYEDAEGKRVYTPHILDLQAGDEIYLYSDGITDQFGEATGKKLGKKRMIQALKDFSHLPMREREEAVADLMRTWQGNLRQLDDQLLIGLKFKG